MFAELSVTRKCNSEKKCNNEKERSSRCKPEDEEMLFVNANGKRKRM